ncbi:MAG: hypothetical protein MUP16_01425 [Sedimentisphaerales bacterium]|nr:hypothetical protein [Sedimentisphaerales bacterium]
MDKSQALFISEGMDFSPGHPGWFDTSQRISFNLSTVNSQFKQPLNVTNLLGRSGWSITLVKAGLEKLFSVPVLYPEKINVANNLDETSHRRVILVTCGFPNLLTCSDQTVLQKFTEFHRFGFYNTCS